MPGNVELWGIKTRIDSRRVSWSDAGAGLALSSGWYPVFQAAVLSIVLMVGVGQDAAILCKAWCDPAQAARTGCHQRDANASPSVTGSDNCGSAAQNSAVLVREDIRRVSDQSARHAVVMPRSQVSPSLRVLRPGSDPGRASPIDPRPLVPALRI